MKSAAVGSLLAASALLAGLAAWTPVMAEEDAARNAALAAATQEATGWLAALDGHRYADSWSEVAAVIREGRTQDDWARDVGTPREAFGSTLMRELKSAEYSTSVRGAPQGRYVTATFLTQFTNAPPALETVLVKFEDERWRIAGYSIQPAPKAASPPSAPDKLGAHAQPKAKE
ncbi:MAG TPA: DUF4019 domain-containing protein [Casimicrobiaceae bacterium]